MEKIYDVIIVGAGAGGLACGARLAGKGKSFLILEAQPAPARKLLASGNGRCNLTNKNLSAAQYPGGGKFAAGILKKFSFETCVKFFEELGVLLKEEDNGRYFSATGRSSSAAGALTRAVTEGGGEIFCGVKIVKAEKKDLFTLTAEDGKIFKAKKLVLACGSPAAPQLGGRADGYKLAESFGHTVIPPSPALAPLNLKNIPQNLKGVRADVRLNGAEEGEIMFTAAGISGLPAQNLSRRPPAEISVNLFPRMPKKEFVKFMDARRKKFPERKLKDFFTGVLHEEITDAFLKTQNLAPSILAGRFKDENFANMIDGLQDWRFETGPAGEWKDAFCAAGGVNAAEIDGDTLESKKRAGLYIIGEVLDVDGKSGGYNLHFAFGCGYAAAEDL